MQRRIRVCTALGISYIFVSAVILALSAAGATWSARHTKEEGVATRQVIGADDAISKDGPPSETRLRHVGAPLRTVFRKSATRECPSASVPI